MQKFILSLFLCALAVSSFGQRRNTVQQPVVPEKPKLIIGITIDQMRYDFLYRYFDKYSEGGFKRFINKGFNFKNHHYNFYPTLTAAGHAAIYTGSIPAINGLVGNNWFEKSIGKSMYCTDDTTVFSVGSKSSAGKMSPRNMKTTTITDQMRLTSNFQSKVVGVALKDRGSILPAGHTGEAYWFDYSVGKFITSSYYGFDLPTWATEFNQLNLADKYLSQNWNTLLPITQYTESTADFQPYEQALDGAPRPTFPYELPLIRKKDDFELIAYTPWGNTITLDFAKAAIIGENLGKGPSTDFLALSFSSTDYIGHYYGPYSIEVQDTYLRLDKEIEGFLNYLDSYLGKENYLVFITADHGVADIPGFANSHKIPGGVLEGSKIRRLLEGELISKFGEGNWILSSMNYQLYLNHNLLQAKNVTVQQIYNVVKDVLYKIPGFSAVVNLNDVSNTMLNSYTLNLVRNGYYEKRSGDIMMIPEPNYFYGYSKGTTHGTGYNYDTHVPLLFYGWKIPNGESSERVSISDITPTLADLLNILPPNGSVGRPLTDIIKK